MTLEQEILSVLGLPKKWQDMEGRPGCVERRVKAAQSLETVLFIYSRYPMRTHDGLAYEVANPSANRYARSMMAYVQSIAQWEEHELTMKYTWQSIHFVIQVHTGFPREAADGQYEAYWSEKLQELKELFPLTQPELFALPRSA